MKKFLMYGVSAAAMAISATAAAQDNSSDIDQAGNNHVVTVDQTGSNDSSTVFQEGESNTADVNQNGLAGSDSQIRQTGDRNTATLTQDDDGTDLQNVAPPLNLSVIDQSGDDNSANVTQSTETLAIRSESSVDQSGDFNDATVVQLDDWQYSEVLQTSDNNIASVAQGVDQIRNAFFQAGRQESGFAHTAEQVGVSGGNRVGAEQAQHVVVAQGDVGQRFVFAGQHINGATQLGAEQGLRADGNGKVVVGVDQRQKLLALFVGERRGLIVATVFPPGVATVGITLVFTASVAGFFAGVAVIVGRVAATTAAAAGGQGDEQGAHQQDFQKM